MSLDGDFFGNSIRSWSIAGVIAGALWVTLYAVRLFVTRRLTTVSERTTGDFDDLAAELLRKIRWYLILAIAVRAGPQAPRGARP